MVRASSINADFTKCVGFALANACIALAGGLVCQYNQSADTGYGSGMLVVGLASVIIGTNLFARSNFVRATSAVIVGSILYKACVAATLSAGLAPNDMKLITAALFLVILVLGQIKKRKPIVRKTDAR